MNENRDENLTENLKNVRRSLLISLGSGCLTLLIAAVAIAVGVLLDLRMDSFPRFTLILLIGSAPFTLIALFFIVRKAIRKSAAAREAIEGDEGALPDPD